MPRKIQVSLSVDADCVAGWIASYGGHDSSMDISRGVFAAQVGIPRLVEMFAKYGIKTTWFMPGHTLETFPKECEMIRDAGHEFALHGYTHESPSAMSIDQQRAVLDKAYKLLTDFVQQGKTQMKITGTCTPMWANSKELVSLLLEYGIQYDHSFAAHDTQCYYLHENEVYDTVDYKKNADDWMNPMHLGNETGIVEIPANNELAELFPFMFIRKAPNSHGWVDVRIVEQIWKDHFDYCYRQGGDFVLPITLHPDTSGRPHILLMVERFIEYVRGFDGVEFPTMQTINEDFRKKCLPSAGARMPAGYT